MVDGRAASCGRSWGCDRAGARRTTRSSPTSSRPRRRATACTSGGSARAVSWCSTTGRHLLLDPYLSDSLTRKYADTDKPHVRMTARVIAPERLDFVDVVTSSHNHTDHLDAETLAPLARQPGAALVVPAANRAFAAERLGARAATPRLDDGETVELARLRDRGRARRARARAATPRRTSGYLVRVRRRDALPQRRHAALRRDGGAAAPCAVDVALLPINGRPGEHGRRHSTAGARSRTRSARASSIPCHYEMFEFNTADPAEFVAECELVGQPYRVLALGERFTLR